MKNNEFTFLNMNSNDMLTKMKKKDLLEFLSELSKYYLTMRDDINLDKNMTFGIEVEFENLINNMNYEDLIKRMDKSVFFNYKGWKMGYDCSLINGGESQSPILYDTEDSWSDIFSLCQYVSRYASIGKNAAGHVHMGAHILGDNKEYWHNFIKLWCAYENVIYRSVYNEYYSKLPGINFCNPKAYYFLEVLEEYKHHDIIYIIDKLSRDRKQSINFQNVKIREINSFINGNTIEFRCPNGTLNPVIWQNNINLFGKILMYSKSKNYDMDTIDERNKTNNDVYYELYSEIVLKQALEFVDQVFNNNEDKVYFLRQYLKDFKTPYNAMTMTKSFTKG